MADRRDEILESIPRGYRPWLHFAATTGSGAVMLAVAVVAIHDLRAVELLVLPVMFVLSNVGEHFAHRTLLHRRIRPFQVLYDQHTPRHHAVYRYDDMAIRSWRELGLVLIPAFGVLTIVVATAPIAVLAGIVLSANAGWLVITETALYVVAYELTHLAYHLPESHPVGRLRAIRFLREHHRRHHHPKLMQRWNFNVTVPLWDVVVGTRISDAEFHARTGAPGATSHRAPTSAA
jgi:sterol desaturase/sphingolipid hydroxylase (fatty acid hydroxylase superfamily)